MLRDMKLHNLRNSVAKRLVSDASVSSKYIRREPVTVHGVWKEIHTGRAHTHLGEAIPLAYAHFLCKVFVQKPPPKKTCGPH